MPVQEFREAGKVCPDLASLDRRGRRGTSKHSDGSWSDFTGNAGAIRTAYRVLPEGQYIERLKSRELDR